MLTLTIRIDASSREQQLRALDIIRRQLADGLQDGAGGTPNSSFSFHTEGRESVKEEAVT